MLWGERERERVQEKRERERKRARVIAIMREKPVNKFQYLFIVFSAVILKKNPKKRKTM